MSVQDRIKVSFGAVNLHDPEGVSLRIDRLPPWGLADVVREYGVTRIATLFDLGDPPGNLDFLRDLPEIDCLVLNRPARRFENADLERITNLRVFRTSVLPLRPLDLSQFKKLEVLRTAYDKNWQNIGGCERLRDLDMKRVPEDLLPEIAKLKSLTRAMFPWGRFTSLDFLNGCPSLERLEMWSCNKATPARSYPVNPNLKEIFIIGGRSISHLEWLTSFPNLESLLLENCGQIESFKPLSQLTKLSGLCTRGNTEAIDGDVRCLANVKFKDGPYITFKPHYNATRKEMKALAGWFKD